MRTSEILPGNTDAGLERQARHEAARQAAELARERFLPPPSPPTAHCRHCGREYYARGLGWRSCPPCGVLEFDAPHALDAEIRADLAREDAQRAADDDYWRDFDGNS